MAGTSGTMILHVKGNGVQVKTKQANVKIVVVKK